MALLGKLKRVFKGDWKRERPLETTDSLWAQQAQAAPLAPPNYVKPDDGRPTH